MLEFSPPSKDLVMKRRDNTRQREQHVKGPCEWAWHHGEPEGSWKVEPKKRRSETAGDW